MVRQESHTNRPSERKVSLVIGGLVTGMAFAAGGAALYLGYMNAGNEKPAKVVERTVTAKELGVTSLDGVINKVCDVSLDTPVSDSQEFKMEQANPDVANGYGQISADEYLKIPDDLCD